MKIAAGQPSAHVSKRRAVALTAGVAQALGALAAAGPKDLGDPRRKTCSSSFDGPPLSRRTSAAHQLYFATRTWRRRRTSARAGPPSRTSWRIGAQAFTFMLFLRPHCLLPWADLRSAGKLVDRTRRRTTFTCPPRGIEADLLYVEEVLSTSREKCKEMRLPVCSSRACSYGPPRSSKKAVAAARQILRCLR